MRTEAISKIDQRISDVDLQGGFSIERRSGIPVQRLNSSVRDENRFGVVKVPQLKSLGSTNFSTARSAAGGAGLEDLDHGRWLEADRMGFGNDAYADANQNRCRGCDRPQASQWRCADLSATQPANR